MTARLTAQTSVANKMDDEKDLNNNVNIKTRKSQAVPITNNQNIAESTAIVWKNVGIQIVLHVMAVYGLYLAIYHAQYKTLLFAAFVHIWAGLAITAGAHRLWAHRSYKASLPLRIFLCFWNTVAGQNSIKEWSRDHRVHHKHVETNADPHNSNRGFFFSHMGWLMCKKHVDVIEKGRKIPLDDLDNDIVVWFQHKYYIPLYLICNIALPTVIPLLWNESLLVGYFVAFVLRYAFTLHSTWLVNSVAHMFGNKPYDTSIQPVESMFVSMATIGEGYHNFHHTFPNDYATSEYGPLWFNLTKTFIDVCCFLGFATDRKQTPVESVISRRKRTGDLASHHNSHHDENIDHEY